MHVFYEIVFFDYRAILSNNFQFTSKHAQLVCTTAFYIKFWVMRYIHKHSYVLNWISCIALLFYAWKLFFKFYFILLCKKSRTLVPVEKEIWKKVGRERNWRRSHLLGPTPIGMNPKEGVAMVGPTYMHCNAKEASFLFIWKPGKSNFNWRRKENDARTPSSRLRSGIILLSTRSILWECKSKQLDVTCPK